MEIFLSTRFKRSYRKRVKPYPTKVNRVKKTLKIFQEYQNHPSLKLHKLSGKDRWSIKVEMDLIITFQYVQAGIVLMDIGTHNEVY